MRKYGAKVNIEADSTIFLGWVSSCSLPVQSSVLILPSELFSKVFSISVSFWHKKG